MTSTTHRFGKPAGPEGADAGASGAPATATSGASEATGTAGAAGAGTPGAAARVGTLGTPGTPAQRARGFDVQWRDQRRTLVDYVGGLWAWKVWIAFGTMLATAGAFFLALTRPNTYASSAVLMVYGSTSAPSPAAAAANLVQAGHLGSSRVMSAVEIIRSRPVARAVVDAVGPEEVHRPYQPIRMAEKEALGLMERIIDKMHDLQMAWFTSEVDFALRTPDGAVPEEVRELTAVAILEKLYVYPDERASTIRLVYYASSPEAAQHVLDAVVRESVRMYGDVFAPPSARSWLETKYAEARAELAGVREQIAAFVTQHGAVDFSDRIESQRQQLAALDAAKKRAHLDLERNKRVIELAREARDRTPKTIEGPAAFADGRDLYLDFLRQKLIELRLEEKRETATMGQGAPESPSLTQARKLIEVVQAEIEERLKHPPIVSRVVENPRWALLDETISRREIENIDLEQTIELYPRGYADANAALQQVEALHQEGLQLQERLAKADDEVEQLGARISAFEITNELDRQGLTSLRPVEPATLPLAKQGPARGKLILAGFAAGLVISITLVLARVRLSRTFLRSSEAAFALGRSDVVGVPRLTRGNLRRFAQARRMGWD